VIPKTEKPSIPNCLLMEGDIHNERSEGKLRGTLSAYDSDSGLGQDGNWIPHIGRAGGLAPTVADCANSLFFIRLHASNHFPR